MEESRNYKLEKMKGVNSPFGKILLIKKGA